MPFQRSNARKSSSSNGKKESSSSPARCSTPIFDSCQGTARISEKNYPGRSSSSYMVFEKHLHHSSRSSTFKIRGGRKVTSNNSMVSGHLCEISSLPYRAPVDEVRPTPPVERAYPRDEHLTAPVRQLIEAQREFHRRYHELRHLLGYDYADYDPVPVPVPNSGTPFENFLKLEERRPAMVHFVHGSMAPVAFNYHRTYVVPQRTIYCHQNQPIYYQYQPIGAYPSYGNYVLGSPGYDVPVTRATRV